jgi:SNF2 family DNA or RNA helicase
MPFELRNSLAIFGGKYNKDYKVSVINREKIPEDLIQYSSKPYSYEAYVEKELNSKYRDEITKQYATKDTIVARDYQKSGFDIIEKAYNKKINGFLLADEVGLGKTITSALVIKDKQFKKILVVTTLAAVPHWRNTLLKFKLIDKEIIIINYDRMQKLFDFEDDGKSKTKRAKNKKIASKGVAPEFDLIIFDESHKLKNNISMRSKLAMKLMTKANFTLWLSATAGQNPLELSYLSPLLAKINKQTVKSMVDFEQWCKGMDLGVSRGNYGKWLWDGSKESIKKIKEMLFDSDPLVALRRVPSDIKDYPEISRELMPIDLSPEEFKNYKLAWSDFKLMMDNKNIKNAKEKKQNSLVAQLRLRQKTSYLKISSTLESTYDLLDNNHQVAISVAFRETLLEMKRVLEEQKISCSVIYGSQTANEKEAERLRFQRGESKVVIFTVEEAISLHQGEHNNAPRTMLIHDLRWSAIQMSQIEGRTHRDGKFSQIYWMFFNGTVEDDIAKVVLRRVINMKAMVGDDTNTLEEIEMILNK